MKLVDDWKDAWKWISMNCMVIATAIQGSWMFIPEDMKASLPSGVVHMATLVLLMAGITGRLIKQGGNDDTGA